MFRRLPIVFLERHIRNLTARSSDRVVVFWGLALIAGSALAATEGNVAASAIVAFGLAACPLRVSTFGRLGLFALGIALLAIGPIFVLFACPAALLAARMPGTSATALLALASAVLLSHHFQSVPNINELSLHLGAASFIVVSSVAAAAAFGCRIGPRAVALLVLTSALLYLVISIGARSWITHATFTSSVFRALVVLLPTCLVMSFLPVQNRGFCERGSRWVFGGALLGAALTLLLPISPIKTAVFDESHGGWATVQASFGPEDFGRSANYTYSLLAAYGSKLLGSSSVFEKESADLPTTDAVFILKMPTKPIANEFSDRLQRWVQDGGRLLIIADHTDLYDTAQHLNAFLAPRFGLKINSDAIFDAQGMPNAPITDRIAAAIGRIDARGRSLPWQTGSSLGMMPMNAVVLATFGMSFSEPGDYSRPNRFGTFFPQVGLRFLNHTAIAAAGVGKGALVVLLDSTPWSNFSIFKEEYKNLFNGIIWALSRPAALQLWGWSAVVLGLLTLVLTFWRSPAPLAAGGLALGLAVGAASHIGIISFQSQELGRDFGLRVVSGATARFEFLKQLVGPGERNFSRIVSAMAKYGFDPSASAPGIEIPRLNFAKKWLLIQPDVGQLPTAEDLVAYVREGGDVTVILAPEQAAQPNVRDWLQSLGIFAQDVTALALAEDARSVGDGLLARRGAALLRDTRTLTKALPTSLLKEDHADQFLQSYTVRPTNFPRTSGFFSVGFSADQFSDASIGDVWQGIEPAVIGKLREHQLAAALSREDPPLPFPEELFFPSPAATSTLPAYLLMKDGKVVLGGRFDTNDLSAYERNASPIDNPVGYLFDLRNRAASFVASKCPRQTAFTHCRARMLGPDMVEWMVSRVSNEDGTIVAIELLHERSFSGLGETLNVVFGN